MRIAPGRYRVTCSRERAHRHIEEVKPWINRDDICGLCGASAKFEPLCSEDSHCEKLDGHKDFCEMSF